MAGNEIEVTKFLFNNLNDITLNHLGKIVKVEIPRGNSLIEISDESELDILTAEEASKKADIYLNGNGISIKQTGASFSYNRLQRAEIEDVFNHLRFSNPDEHLDRIDQEVKEFHEGKLKTRSRPWSNLFSEDDFKSLMRFLMMEGSPNLGISRHPAQLILTAPKDNISLSNINVYNFEEYFDKFKDKLRFSIRRQWIGQLSKSEHGRAKSLAKKPGNQEWVFDDVSGNPRKRKKGPNKGKRWRDEFGPNDRKTVYFIMLEKLK